MTIAGLGGGSSAATVRAVADLDAQVLPGLRAEVATLILQGASGGSIDLAVAAGFDEVADVDGGLELALTIEASGDSLLAAAEQEARDRGVLVELYAYVLDSDNRVRAHLARRVTIRTAEWGERLASGGVRFLERLEVPAREALSIRTLVLIPAEQKFGMHVLEVGPTEPESTRTLVSPRFQDDCGDWLSIATPGAAMRRSSALPLWRAGETARALVRSGESPGFEAPIHAVFESASGEVVRVVAAVDAVPENASRPSAGGAEASEASEAEVSFQVPDLALGAYSLSVASAGGSVAATAAAEVWIVGHSETEDFVGGMVCAWPAVVREARRLEADIGPVRSSGTQSRSFRRQAVRAYAELLRGLGGDRDLETSARNLVDWEAASMGKEVQKNLAALVAAQVEVTQALAQVDPECLLPVFELHRRAYSEHFERRQFALAGHSRRMAATVAEIWLALPERGRESGWLPDALVSLAGTADRHLMFAASQVLLERAVEMEPANRDGRLLLSILHEKLGEYGEAARQLEELLAVAPANAQARLRLAILQQRLGRVAASRVSLRRVIAQGPRPWILSLAYQTLVKGLYAEGEFGKGLRALAAAELELPNDPQLALAKAYGLDRLGREVEALAVLEGSLSGEEVSRSHRLAYAEAAAQLARGIEQRLNRNVMIRRPRLGSALASALGDSE